MGAAARPAFIADGRKSGTPLLLGDVRIVAGHLCLDGKKRLHILPRAAPRRCHSGTGWHSFIRRRAKTLYDQSHVVPAILEGGAEARLQHDEYSGWLVLWMRYRVSLLPS
jgi:hypothetical protein